VGSAASARRARIPKLLLLAGRGSRSRAAIVWQIDRRGQRRVLGVRDSYPHPVVLDLLAVLGLSCDGDTRPRRPLGSELPARVVDRVDVYGRPPRVLAIRIVNHQVALGDLLAVGLFVESRVVDLVLDQRHASAQAHRGLDPRDDVVGLELRVVLILPAEVIVFHGVLRPGAVVRSHDGPVVQHHRVGLALLGRCGHRSGRTEREASDERQHHSKDAEVPEVPVHAGLPSDPFESS